MSDPRLYLDAAMLRQFYDREAFGFEHNLAQLDIFQFDSMVRLAELYDVCPQDCFVSASAPSPASEFYSIQHDTLIPSVALTLLESSPLRILLKRPENHDPRFRALLDTLFYQIRDAQGPRGNQPIVRLESAIFISSASAITPFHFDPEIAFFSQIEGEKEYHVYDPEVLLEKELERLYVCDMISVGQVSLEGRDPVREHVFKLSPGSGLHQPQNAPHWVATRKTRSISYTLVFETAAGRSLGRSRCCNHYVRRLRLEPQCPGTQPSMDRMKAGVMDTLIPVRKGLRQLLARVHAS